MNQQQQVLVVSLSSKVEVTPLTDYQALIQASYPRLTSSLTGSTSAGARNRALRRQTYEQIGCEIDAVVKMTMRMRQGLFEGWTHMIGQPVFLGEKQRTLRWPA
ncbi:MAG: hypothetical protein JJU11_18660, partial [Candidatus Sumerlaeia bacterium]|nr:hypothetical protein [Candidatus Sumerlaeia bacterium]